MGFLLLLINLYTLVLLARCVFSFFTLREGSPMASVYDVCYTLTEPVLAPIRSLIGNVSAGGMGLDISPIILMVALTVLASIIR